MNPSTPSPEQPGDAAGLSIEPAPAQPGEKAFGVFYAAALLTLTGLTFALGVLVMWIFSYTFWTLFEAQRRAFGGGAGISLIAPVMAWLTRGALDLRTETGWRLDIAVALGVTATWSLMYFALDYLTLLGNRRAQQILRKKAQRLLQRQGEILPDERSFVEIRALTKTAPLIPDVGWLLFFPDRLLFIGESQTLALPRTRLTRPPILHRSPGGLTGAALTLSLASPDSSLRLVSRDTASSLSATTPDTERLQKMLTFWLTQSDK